MDAGSLAPRTGQQRGWEKCWEMGPERKADAWHVGNDKHFEQLCANSRTLRRELADQICIFQSSPLIALWKTDQRGKSGVGGDWLGQ